MEGSFIEGFTLHIIIIINIFCFILVVLMKMRVMCMARSLLEYFKNDALSD